jgi:hypothetical protein
MRAAEAAAALPAGPPPTTNTSHARKIGIFLDGSVIVCRVDIRNSCVIAS